MRIISRAAACGALAATLAAPVVAQDAIKGRRLYQDTLAATGNSALTGACTSCHGSVADRRMSIAGDRFAEIDPQLALDRLRTAIGLVGPMQQFEFLAPQELLDLAAYLADTPRRSVERLDFNPTTVNTASPAQSVDLVHAVATNQNLQVLRVEISGAQASRFTRVSDACDQQPLAPAASCRVSLSFSSPDSSAAAAELILTLRQGGEAAPTFTRVVALSGKAGAPAPTPDPPPPTAGTNDDSGGGSLDANWLLLLALAVWLLARPEFRSLSAPPGGQGRAR